MKSLSLRVGILPLALFALVLLIALARPVLAATGSDVVLIEDMTWPEIRARMQAGATTIIVPTGGTEQNGPHMALGKHNYIIHYTAQEIARRVGNVLVAPVLAYVPEGSWDPPEGHMRFPGTVSLPDSVFEAVLGSAVQSYAAEGFKTILFIGEHGSNQRPQELVAKRMTAALRSRGVRVFQIGDYYDTHNGQVEWLKSQGFTANDIGEHAGVMDTSELMAIDPDGVRTDLLKTSAGGGDGSKNGVVGDPSKSTAAVGQKLIQLKIDAAVREIRKDLAAGL